MIGQHQILPEFQKEIPKEEILVENPESQETLEKTKVPLEVLKSAKKTAELSMLYSIIQKAIYPDEPKRNYDYESRLLSINAPKEVWTWWNRGVQQIPKYSEIFGPVQAMQMVLQEYPSKDFQEWLEEQEAKQNGI